MTKRFLTGLKPTSSQIHIANYFGAVKPMLDLAQNEKDAEFFLFLASMHGLTQVHNATLLRENSLNILKIYLACGVDAKRFLIYNPAEIAGHVQLGRALTCITTMGFMERMHAYKDALAKGNAGETSVGTFCYPILMAADILLYDANFVPVGKDQKQHVEFARDIAQKFNKLFGDTFILPEPYIQQEVATVPGIDGRKMSKSYDNYIGMLDDEKVISKKIKQISTDAKPIEEPKDPDACNVYNILKLFLTQDEDKDIRDKYTAGGLSYKVVKDFLYEKVMGFLSPIQAKYHQIGDQEIKDILKQNNEKANAISAKKIEQVYKAVGFTL